MRFLPWPNSMHAQPLDRKLIRSKMLQKMMMIKITHRNLSRMRYREVERKRKWVNRWPKELDFPLRLALLCISNTGRLLAQRSVGANDGPSPLVTGVRRLIPLGQRGHTTGTCEQLGPPLGQDTHISCLESLTVRSRKIQRKAAALIPTWGFSWCCQWSVLDCSTQRTVGVYPFWG